MTTERRGAAMLDRRHRLELGEVQMPDMGGAVDGSGTRKMSATSIEVRTAQPSGELSPGLNKPACRAGS